MRQRDTFNRRVVGYYRARPKEKKMKKQKDAEKVRSAVSLLVIGFIRDYNFHFIDVINDIIETYLGDLAIFDSIIMNNESIDRLIRLLAKSGKIGDLKRLKIETKYKLLFRASRDGKKNFHKYCDGYSNTITIVTNDFGHMFGGYLAKEWDKTNGKKK
eukprot:309430_1